MLRCADNSLYTGIAADIVKRIKQHLGVLAGGAKYTHSHRVIYIEAVWKLDSDKIARKLEYRLKRLNPDDIFLVFSEILFGLQIRCCDTGEYNKYFNFSKEFMNIKTKYK